MSRGRKSQIQTAGLGPAVVRLRKGGASMTEIANALGVTQSMVKTYLRGVDLRENPHIAGLLPTAIDGPATASDLFRLTYNEEPMPHQLAVMEDTRDTVLVKGRQVGASTAAGVLAVHVARTVPRTDIVIVSYGQTQAAEITNKARGVFDILGEKLRQDSVAHLRLANGSRIIALPGSYRSIRGYSPKLLILDEAAYIGEDIFLAALPMLAATRGRLIAQSTPAGPYGWFFDAWEANDPSWLRLKVRSDEARTITPETLAKARAQLSRDDYMQEYEASFVSPGLGLISPARLELLTLKPDDSPPNIWQRMREREPAE